MQNQDGAVELVSMFWKMSWTGKISTIAFIFYGIPLIVGGVWSAAVSQPKFDPSLVNLKDGGSVGWSIGAVVSTVLKSVDAEVRPYLEPKPVDRRPVIEQQADRTDQIVGDGQ